MVLMMCMARVSWTRADHIIGKNVLQFASRKSLSLK